MGVILSNDDIVKHFANEHSLTSRYSREGITLEQQVLVFGLSSYKQVRLGDIIRAVFGGVANNPSKSIVFLVTDYEPGETSDIATRANQLFVGERKGRLRLIGGRSVESYFETSILQLTHFSEEENKRIKLTTQLAQSGSKRSGSRELLTYSKTLDGFLIGDPFAYIGVMSSTLEDARSGYKIWGTASSHGETNAQEMTLLILYWLFRKYKGEGSTIDFIREVLGYGGKATDLQKNTPYYHLFKTRLAGCNIPRLADAGIIEYFPRSQYDEIPNIKLSQAGYKLIELIDPLLIAIGWYVALAEKRRIVYAMLDEVVRPDLPALWRYRGEKLDIGLRNEQAYDEFRRLVTVARKRHLEDYLEAKRKL